MSEKVTFSYFYGNDADQYSFYRIPKLLFTSEHFKHLSSDAKILYGLMLDRMALSIKNHWFDEQNRAYIYFSIEDIMELLNCGRNKAIKSLQELDDETGIGLVAKRRQGFGKANIIYVKSFMIVEATSDRGICTYVSPGDAKPGDLIFFQGTYNTSGASHVGIYVGNGMMIHCGNPIQYASIETNYWQQHFMCFGRLD